MKLKLNNRTFNASYNSNGELIFRVHDDFDKLFFKRWQEKASSGLPKKDYIEDVDYSKIGECGILKNCFPVMDLNESLVKLVYDYNIKEI